MSKQADIQAKLRVKSQIDPESEVRVSIDFMKTYLYRFPFIKTLVLGISGGQDSSLNGRLAQLAIEEMREETGDDTYRFIAVRLPYGVQHDEDDANRALDFIHPDEVLTINIKPAVDQTVAQLLAAGVSVSDFNKGNIKARERMIVQYAIAGARAGLVLGSDHAAEAVTGFYTKFGDGAADIVPLWRLNKRQGRQMLVYLGADPSIYQKVPTADLEDNKPLEADEVALGVSYEAIDNYLEGRPVADQAQKQIEKLYDNSEHKRRLPITVYDTWWQA